MAGGGFLFGLFGEPGPPPHVVTHFFGSTLTRLDDVSIELALGGSYYDTVMAHAPVGFWLLNEQLPAVTGAREQVGDFPGTYVGGVTGGNRGPFPHGGTAVLFNGTTGYVNVGDEAALGFTGPSFSAECWFQTTTAAFTGLLGKSDSANTLGGWRVYIYLGKIEFYTADSAGALLSFLQSPLTYNDGEWHHVVCTWNDEALMVGGGFPILFGSVPTIATTAVEMYIDGVLVASDEIDTGTIGTPALDFVIGALTSLDNSKTGFFPGFITGAAVYDTALTSADIAAHYASAQWTDVTEDVLVEKGVGISLEYGTQGTQPLDRLADSGTLEFTLDNSVYNSAGLAGYYAPRHASVRSGFTFDIPVRAILTYDETPRTKFWGRLMTIDPLPGVDGFRRTSCIAQDYMVTLVDTDVRAIVPQLDQDDDVLIRTVFDAMPYDAQPMELALDAVVDSYTYAFDDLEGGRKAATAIDHVLVSAWSKGGTRGDGTFWTRNRLAAVNAAVDYVVSDAQMFDVESASDRLDIFNHVRTVTHPRKVDVAATTILFQSSGKVFVAAQATVEIWGEYRNPDSQDMTVGGTEIVAPVSGTDFEAHSVDDGSGTDLTGDVTVTADAFASTVKLTITNTHATLGAYFVDVSGDPLLQVRGKGIYDIAPVTSAAFSGRAHRPITIDLHYQDDANVGQALADFILQEREVILDPVKQVGIDPHDSDEMMRLALDGEAGTLLTITEAQTGLTGAQVEVRSVRITVGDALTMTVSLGVIPIVVGAAWVLDDPDLSILDETTILAYG